MQGCLTKSHILFPCLLDGAQFKAPRSGRRGTVKLGNFVSTPRFCTVQISAMFAKEREARECGYTEPTYYKGGDCVILGKSLDLYHMVFAAVPIQKKP